MHAILLAALGVCLAAAPCLGATTLRLGAATLRLDERGVVVSVRCDGREYAQPAAPPAFEVATDKGVFGPASVQRKGKELLVTFEGGGHLRLALTERRGFALLRVTDLAVPGTVERLRLFCLPTGALETLAEPMNACYDRRFAAAVMATEVNVRAQALRGPGAGGNNRQQIWLTAETVKQFGIQPAGAAVIACPRAEFEETIARMERAAGLPSPRPGGVWSKRSPWAKRSYLFVTRFSEADTDEVIALARRGGFHTILIGQESWCASTGRDPINRLSFPRGLESLRATIARLKRAGFRVGLHLLALSIYPPDLYLAPVPDKRLMRDAFADLAADVDPAADFIPTMAPPKAFPAVDGGSSGYGTVIQIGDELIHYAERSMEPPYGFRGCQRGVHGTRAAAHGRGDRVAHLKQVFGSFYFGLDTTLLDEMADRLAAVVNTCGVDMVYWDGSEMFQGEHWYGTARLHKAFYDRFRNKDLLLQSSSFGHYSWHFVSRAASADGHGDLKGYLDQRTPSFKWYNANLMPVDIGWYYLYDTSATTDQFEYVLNKSLGCNASISLQTSPSAIREHPYLGEIIDLIGAYERLRLGPGVPATTRARLREPKRDYHLEMEGNKPVLRRVVYEPWRMVEAAEGATWEVDVKDGPCRVGVEVAAQRGRPADPGSSGGPTVSAEQPFLEVDGKRLAWEVSLAEGQVLRYRPGWPTRVVGPRAGQTSRVASPKGITLTTGRHRVRFACAGGLRAGVLVRLILLYDDCLPASGARH